VKYITDCLHSIIDKLKQPALDPDRKYSKIDELFQEIDDRTNLAMRRRGGAHDITHQQFIEQIGVPFVYDLSMEVEDFFSCTSVLKAFGVLDSRNLPDAIGELSDDGDLSSFVGM
jgi:hypothetical protein